MNELVVANVYKLHKRDGKFIDNTGKDNLYRENHLVSKQWADEMNDEWESRGMKAVIDEEKTAEARQTILDNAAMQAEQDAAVSAVSDALISVAKDVKKPKAKSVDKEALLDKVEELTGERPHHATGVSKLEATIKEHSN